MGSTTGGAHLLLVINDVQPFKDNSITSPAMCNQSLSRKWICTRVTKSVAKALSIQADLKIYATLLVAGTRVSVWITAKSSTSNLKCKQPNWMDVNYVLSNIMLLLMFTVNILGLNFSSNQKTRTFVIIWAPRTREGPAGLRNCFSPSHKGKKGWDSHVHCWLNWGQNSDDQLHRKHVHMSPYQTSIVLWGCGGLNGKIHLGKNIMMSWLITERASMGFIILSSSRLMFLEFWCLRSPHI